MASIIQYRDGLRRIDFCSTPNGKRQSVRLGRVSLKVAEMVNAKIEAIVADKLAGRPHDAEVSQWLAKLDEAMLSKLRAAGLADGVGLAQVTLGDFLTRLESTLTMKASTKLVYGNVTRNLREYFTPARLVRDIRPEDADMFRAWLVEQGLAPATVSRRIIAARTIWKAAMRWKFAGDNVFAGVKAGRQSNEARKHFVTRDVIAEVMAACPDNEWRLLIALSRFAGLRCPSESLALQWQDVNWEKDRIIVRSSKTEHHVGGESRTIPLFAELRPYMLAAFTEAKPGSEYVLTRYRGGGVNMRTQFQRIIKRAGLVPWPKLFHNLRASRETELIDEFDLATACKWIGNSPEVAARHYAMSRDLNADFTRAAGTKTEPAKRPAVGQQKGQQQAAASDGQEMTLSEKNTEIAGENKAFSNSVQSHANADKMNQWSLQDSNLQLSLCKSDALAVELRDRVAIVAGIVVGLECKSFVKIYIV